MNDEKKSVLIVENEVELCEMLVFEFEMKGYRVLYAHDGVEALETVRSDTPDVVVTDIRMQRMDGLELLGHLKKRDVDSPTVVLITAYSDIQPAVSYHRGAEAIFTKPFTLKGLVERVEWLLTPRRERWSRDADAPPWRRLLANARDIVDGKNNRIVEVGRGGLCLSSGEPDLNEGESVDIQVTWQGGPLRKLNGAGVVRWKVQDKVAGETESFIYGIEFTRIADDSIDELLQWLEDNRPTPYIPCFADISM